jgi:hypothetical protein
MTDVLFVVEAGNAPARKPVAFTLPIPVGGSIRTASISYPVIAPSTDPLLGKLSVNGTDMALERVVDVNVMARRALRDEMPGMVLRGATRAVTKAVLQQQLEKQVGAFGAIVGIVASAATEQADDRMWRTLPGRVYIARGYLPPGKHRVHIDGRDLGIEVDVNGQYALIPLRFQDAATVVAGSTGSLGQLPVIAMAEPPAVPVPVELVQTVSTRTEKTAASPKPRAVVAKPAAAAPKLVTK